MNVKFKIWCIIRMVTIWQKYWHDGQIKWPSPKGPTAAQTLGFTTLQGQSFTTQGQWFMMIYATIFGECTIKHVWTFHQLRMLHFCDNRTLPEASLTRTRTHLVPTFWPSYHLQRTRCSVWSVFVSWPLQKNLKSLKCIWSKIEISFFLFNQIWLQNTKTSKIKRNLGRGILFLLQFGA